MAIVINNDLTLRISGRVGGIVFKSYGTITIVTSRPKSPSTQSLQQRVNRSKFQNATQWAKTAMLDPNRKKHYRDKAIELGLTNAYTAAVTDYMRNR